MSLPLSSSLHDTCLHHLQRLLFAADSLSPPHSPIHAAASAVNYSSAASIAALNPNYLHPTHHLDLLADEHDLIATGNHSQDPHTDTLAFALQQVLLAKKKKGFVSPLKTARSDIDVRRLSEETQRRLKRNDPIPETEPPTLTVSVATQTEECAPKKQEPNETNRHVSRIQNGNPPFSTDFSNGFPQRHMVMQKRPRTDFNLFAQPRNQPDETNENSYSPSESTSVPIINSIFVTAKEQLEKDSIRQPHRFDRTLTPLPYPPVQNNGLPPPNKKRLLGTSTKRGKFYPPMLQKSNVNESEEAEGVAVAVGAASAAKNTMKRTRSSFQCPLQKQQEKERNKDRDKNLKEPDEPMDERLRNIEPAMVQKITNEIMHQSVDIEWDDIAGLEHAKNSVKEIVVWPMLRPDIFTGLRGPPKGLLLFGPPGTGKTLIGKCIASQSGATFFSISSSSLTSKWIGEGEKMVRALFTVARCHQPAVIFVDEIDSLLSSRTEGEVEASRRIKTEFLIQFDGCGTTTEEDRILVVGATNRPQEIDEAARRRFRKRLYIPLPETCGRSSLMRNLLKKQVHSLSEEEIEDVVAKTEGYSGSDVDGLCREAALGPIRCIGDIRSIAVEQVRPVNHQDFISALGQVRASVSDKDLEIYRIWNREYGSCG